MAREAGHEITTDAATADVLVVNTCAFIDSAKQESIDAILEMAAQKRDGRCSRLVVTGCLAERYRDELRQEIPEIDAVLGTGEVPQILEAIGGRRSAAGGRESVSPLAFYPSASTLTRTPSAERRTPGASREPRAPIPDYLYDADTPRYLTTPKHFAYVKVAEGCDYTCAFCIIPTLRGAVPQPYERLDRPRGPGARRARGPRAAAHLPGHDLLRHRPRRARRARTAAARAQRHRRPVLDPAALPLPDDDHRRRPGGDGRVREGLPLHRPAAPARLG